MNGPSPRHSNRFGKTHPFLLPGLVVVIVILSFNYWRTSRLNKELIASVSVSQAKSQKLDHEMKDSHQKFESRLSELEEEKKRQEDAIKSNKKVWEDEKSKLRSELDEKHIDVQKLEGDVENVKQEITKLKADKVDLQSKITEANKTIEMMNAAAKGTSTALDQQRKENFKIMMFVGAELGKAGIEQLLSQAVSLPDNFTIPSPDQQPMCMKRAEELCKAQMSRPVQVVGNQDNVVIQSPNAPKDGTREVVVGEYSGEQQQSKGGDNIQPGANSQVNVQPQEGDSKQEVVNPQVDVKPGEGDSKQGVVNPQADLRLGEGDSKQGGVNPLEQAPLSSDEQSAVIGDKGTDGIHSDLAQGGETQANPAQLTGNGGKTAAGYQKPDDGLKEKDDEGYNMRGNGEDDLDGDDEEDDDENDDYNDKADYGNVDDDKETRPPADFQSEEEGEERENDGMNDSKTTPPAVVGTPTAPPQVN